MWHFAFQRTVGAGRSERVDLRLLQSAVGFIHHRHGGIMVGATRHTCVVSVYIEFWGANIQSIQCLDCSFPVLQSGMCE
jgi:hypothetical protein